MLVSCRRTAVECRRTLTSVVHPVVGGVTHDVLNQSPEYPPFDAFASDGMLAGVVSAHGGDWGADHLSKFGRYVGDPGTPALAYEAQLHTPQLQQYDRHGRRIDVVNFHPSYHTIMRNGIENQVPSFAWRNAGKSGAHVIRAALAVLQYQAEPGTSCPMTMTFACVPPLRGTPSVADDWVPRLTSPVYDPRDVPAHEKDGCTLGMSMTEKQGGSDVRANTTTAEPLTGAHGPGEQYSLTGHKWFTSAPMCDAFLTLAQTPEGLSCFLVPRWLPDGTRNTGFRVTRLKDKMGDKSNASSEVEYNGAWGVMVGDPGRGVRTIVEMVVHTRLDCALGSAGLMRQAVRMATHHAAGRSAFGGSLLSQPAMRAVLADIGLESEAALAMVFRVAAAFDATELDPTNEAEQGFKRVATAVAKYWICKRTPGVVYEAMECHGGNGYVDEWHLPRLYRQAPLNSIWEGSGNVICLDILRAMAREPDAVATYVAEITADAGADTRYRAAADDMLTSLHALQRASNTDMQTGCRFVVEKMARVQQASALVRAVDAGTDADTAAAMYFATRLDPMGACNYGAAAGTSPAADFIIGRQTLTPL